MILGCIGDDFTGSSDLANTLAKGGMRTVQYNGVPSAAADPAVEAGVVALKTRTTSAAFAVAQSLAALDWLRRQGCRQFLFKYCSTFDSTPEGNIGPVLDALVDGLGASRAIVCPAFPATGRYDRQLPLQKRARTKAVDFLTKPIKPPPDAPPSYLYLADVLLASG